MKKIVSLIVILFLLSGCGKNENEFVVATEAGFAPYEYYENGEIVGVDIDIAKEIARELGKELVVKDVAFDSIINEVKTGKSDIGAAGISYSDERAKEVDFSIDYVISRQIGVVRSDDIADIKDLSSKKIAVQLGSASDTYVSKKYDESKIVRHKKYLSAIQDLKDGKVDVVIMDELPAKELINNNDSLKIMDGYLTEESYGMIVKKGNKDLLDVVNRVLSRLKNEGKIDGFVINHTS